MSHDLLRSFVVVLIVAPLAGGCLVALVGSRVRGLVRWLSVFTALIPLVLSCVLAHAFAKPRLAEAQGKRVKQLRTFVPEFVPGDPGDEDEPNEPSHRTAWDLIRFDRGTKIAVQFFLGIDGLNVWLIVLTTLLTTLAILVSWNSIEERLHEFHALLLLLEACMLGAFLAFDIVLFYAFFELTLVPLFFLIGIWGGPQRRYAARKFFVFTLAGSVFTLLGLVGVFLACHNTPIMAKSATFSLPDLVQEINRRLPVFIHAKEDFHHWQTAQFWIFIALSIGFAVKVPLVPLHTWLPLAHVEAPTAGSVLLAGVMLKLGTYGFLRLALPLAPDPFLKFGIPVLGTLAAIGIIHGGLCALAQDDIKKLVAYSSISHLGLCMLGIVAGNAAGISGSLLQMINHGLSTGGLFLIVGMLYERYHSRKLDDYGGLMARLKILSACFVVACLSSLGLPGLNGFVGECLVIFGVFDMQWIREPWPIFAAIGGVGILLGAWYLLTTVLRVCFGPLREPPVGKGLARDLNVREIAILAPLVVLFVLLGVYPQPVLDACRKETDMLSRLVKGARERAERVEKKAQEKARS